MVNGDSWQQAAAALRAASGKKERKTKKKKRGWLGYIKKMGCEENI
jgi:hypothetical protein